MLVLLLEYIEYISVKCAGRLVRKNYLRFVHDSAGNRSELLLTAGKMLYRFLRKVVYLHKFQRVKRRFSLVFS